jgi:DNA-binding MurR/RpiR family transcriptional regulator
VSASIGLERRLEKRNGSLTPGERRISAYLAANLRTLPFESVATIAASVGVSEMSVIRFIRSLGYANLKHLKEEMKDSVAQRSWSLDDRLERFRVPSRGPAPLKESLRLEIDSLVQVYELTTSARFRAAVQILLKARTIYVVGFQASKGLALDFATRLKYARGGVRFLEGVSGTFSEVLDEPPAGGCLVLVDTVAYAANSVRLAEKARSIGLPLIVVTDKFSDWGFDHTEHVLQASTHARTFWDSQTSLAALLNLLINALAAELGPQATERFNRMNALGRHFDAFVDGTTRKIDGADRGEGGA